MRTGHLLMPVFAASLALGSAQAQTPASRWYPVPSSVVFQTGDSWSDAGNTYRLYGVQACLRGTTFTNAHGLKRDCGEASLSMLVALIRDLRPQCYSAAIQQQTRTVFVFCVATRVEGAGKGSRIDLGTALITTGFAFASLKPDGEAVHEPYRIAERLAHETRAGLWAFNDVPDPNAIILHSLRQGGTALAAPTPQP